MLTFYIASHCTLVRFQGDREGVSLAVEGIEPMKNYLAFVTCLLLLLSLFACGQQETKEPDPGAAGQAEEVADTTRLDSYLLK